MTIMELNMELGKIDSIPDLDVAKKRFQVTKQMRKVFIRDKNGNKKLKMKQVQDEAEKEAFTKLVKKLLDKKNCYDIF